MHRFQRVVVVVVVAGLFAFGAASTAAAGQGLGAAGGDPAGRRGRIAGTVTDVHGHPLDGAMVSAFGPFGAELVVSDGNGRFVLQSLAPGRYLVQAHVAGFATSRRELVRVTAGRPAVHAIAMSPAGPASRPVLPARAGLGLVLAAGGGAGRRFRDRGFRAPASRTRRTITPGRPGACAGLDAASSSRPGAGRATPRPRARRRSRRATRRCRAPRACPRRSSRGCPSPGRSIC